MHNVQCWNCDAISHHVLVNASSATSGDDPQIDEQSTVFYGAFRCSSCQAFAVGVIIKHYSQISADATSMLRREEMYQWFPSPNMTRSYSDVPKHIADAATEAFECQAQRHYRASILLSRSVIEATAKEKNIVKGNLASRIGEMEDQGLIRKHIRVAADTVRAFGNDMAHGDFVHPVSALESDQVISLMEEILDEVFQSPAKIDRVTAAVEARKQAAPGNE